MVIVNLGRAEKKGRFSILVTSGADTYLTDHRSPNRIILLWYKNSWYCDGAAPETISCIINMKGKESPIYDLLIRCTCWDGWQMPTKTWTRLRGSRMPCPEPRQFTGWFLFPTFLTVCTENPKVHRESQGVGRKREQTRVSLSFAHHISLNWQGLENAPRRCVWWLHITYTYLVYQNNRELLLVLDFLQLYRTRGVEVEVGWPLKSYRSGPIIGPLGSGDKL